MVDKESRRDRIKLLVNYFTVAKNSHDFYFLKFFSCEILNLVNIVGQVYLMDTFLDGEFSRYGISVLAMTEQDFFQRNDVMSRVFPKVAKCTFHKSGPSGTVEKLDGICVLPLNIINEKIYVFLWFWFIFVCTWSGLHVFYRLITIISKGFRTMLLNARASLVPMKQVLTICKKLSMGDWFLLYQLGKNIDPIVFKDFLNEMYREFDDHDKSNQAYSKFMTL